MSNKKFLLFIISLVLFALSFVTLITAMIIHAVYGDGAYLAAIVGMAAFALAFISIITTCIFGKGEKK